jgi:MFS family permease
VTFALLLVTALASFEGTVVATAMPTIVGELKGLRLYPWVFAVFLLASTLTMPLYGRLADLHGRRKTLLAAVVLFAGGTLLCAAAGSMTWLVAARALQGLGAGGLVPVSMTVAGDLFSLEERARVQGIFSSVWGTASLLGPVAGAFVTESFGWRWVFVPILPLGLLAGALVWTQMVETTRAPAGPLPVLSGLFAIEGTTASYAASVLLGTTIYGVTAYVPLYVQGALGGTAHSAGAVVTPLVFAWALSAVVAGRHLPARGFRATAVFGAVIVALGLASLVAATRLEGPTLAVSAACGLIGLGLGPSSLSQLLAVQHVVPEERRGIATSLVPFFRTVGGSAGVVGLGALLFARLGIAPDAAALLLRSDAAVPPGVRSALHDALLPVFEVLLAFAFVHLAVVARLPAGGRARGAD